MKNTIRAFALVSCLVCGFKVFAIGLNEPVPAFEAIDDEGNVWKSTDHIGKKMVVLYFYPADMTGGCTAQACGYRDRMDSFARLNAEVIGVSGDTAKNHQVFKKAHQLNFTLLADTDGKIAELFGVPVSLGKKTVTKSIDGVDVDLTRNATAKRWTFIIDRNGKIVHRDDRVNAKADPDSVEMFIKAVE
jgi:peroxiredoxin Q/BCP